MPSPLLQSELKDKLSSMYDVKDLDTIFVFGFRTQVRMRGSHASQWGSRRNGTCSTIGLACRGKQQCIHPCSLQFGGGKSTGFGVIYDDKKAALQFEPKYRLIRVRYGDFGLSKRLDNACMARETARMFSLNRPAHSTSTFPLFSPFRSPQNGLQKKVDKSRKQKKERRNRARKVRGVKKHGERLREGGGDWE